MMPKSFTNQRVDKASGLDQVLSMCSQDNAAEGEFRRLHGGGGTELGLLGKGTFGYLDTGGCEEGIRGGGHCEQSQVMEGEAVRRCKGKDARMGAEARCRKS